MDSELYSKYLLKKSEYLKNIDPKTIELTQSLTLTHDIISKYRDSFVIKYKPNVTNRHTHLDMTKWLIEYFKEVYFVTYKTDNALKLDHDSLFYKTLLLILDWNPETSYNCPISLYSDVLFNTECKLNFNLNFDYYGSRFNYYRNAINLDDQIYLTKKCLSLAKYNNSLWQNKITSISGDYDYDFIGKDSYLLDQLQYSNFGKFYDFEYQLYEYMVVKNETVIHKENINKYKNIPKPDRIEMDQDLLKIIKKFAYNLCGREDLLGDEYDTGFIYFNRTYTYNKDYVDPFNSTGDYKDYPMLNICLGCTSILLLEVSDQHLPIGFYVDGGSILHVENSNGLKKKLLTPYSKSYSLQGLILQDAIRIIEDQETYTDELDIYNSKSEEDQKIINLLRKMRIDLQLRKTKTSWSDHIPRSSLGNSRIKEFYAAQMQDMITTKVMEKQEGNAKDKDKDNTEYDKKTEDLDVKNKGTDDSKNEILQATNSTENIDLNVKRDLTKEYEND